MNWLNTLTIFLIGLGILFIVFGSYREKGWAIGLIIILVVILARAMIWFSGLF